MILRSRLFIAMFGIAVVPLTTIAQTSVDSVQGLVTLYESLSDKERVSFLQAIALVGIKGATQTATPAPPASTAISPQMIEPSTVAPETTGQIPRLGTSNTQAQSIQPIQLTNQTAPSSSSNEANLTPVEASTPAKTTPTINQDQKFATLELPLPEPAEHVNDTDIKAASLPNLAPVAEIPPQEPAPVHRVNKPTESIPSNASQITATITPEQLPVPTPQPAAVVNLQAEKSTQLKAETPIRIVARRQMDYGYAGSASSENSAFGLLLPEYSQRVTEGGAKITVEDLRNEAINFYIGGIEKQISDCGYHVISGHEPVTPASEGFVLETGISRIVINKTLFETSIIGEASAKLYKTTANNSKPEERTAINTRSSKTLANFDNNTQRNKELKGALGHVIEQLSDQMSVKICSDKP